MEIELNDVALTGVKDIKINEGLNKITTASFKIPYQALTGNEDIKIEIPMLELYPSEVLYPSDTLYPRFEDSNRRFWGTLQKYSEANDGMLNIEATSKEKELKQRQVPYTEIAYTDKDGGWIAKQLLQPFSAWCSVTEISESSGNIPYIHFVHQTRAEALTDIADLLGMYWLWSPIDNKFRLVTLGDLTSIRSIDSKYISEERWVTDMAKIYNFIYVKGGLVGSDYITKFAWDGASFETYGMREFKPHADAELTNATTAQSLADALLGKYKDALITGKAKDVPYDGDLKVGETIAVTNTKHDGTYLIQAISIDLEKWTMNADFSNIPVLFEQEIRDIQADLERLKRSTMSLYEDGKPILVEMETLKRGSSLTQSETFNAEMELPITLPGTMGGLLLDDDSIHER